MGNLYRVVLSAVVLGLSFVFAWSGSLRAASLVGSEFKVTFTDPSILAAPVVDTVLIGGSPELRWDDSSQIADKVFLGGEQIDIGDDGASIHDGIVEYIVRGDGDPHPSDPQYSLAGWGPDARFEFAVDEWGPEIFAITDVEVELTDVIDVSLGDDVTFSPIKVWLRVGDLGVAEATGGPDLGTIRLNLTLTVVPEPSSWLLLSLGLAGIGVVPAWRRRRST